MERKKNTVRRETEVSGVFKGMSRFPEEIFGCCQCCFFSSFLVEQGKSYKIAKKYSETGLMFVL